MAGLGQGPARQAALHAGLPHSVRAVAVQKVCGSGLQAVMQGAHALRAGMAEIVVAGGMENMSASPYLLPRARQGYRMGHQTVVDSVILDGLWDPYNQIHMGSCAEKCAQKYGFTRQEQDAYAAESFRRANAAQMDGRFAEEIAPVEIDGGAVNLGRVEKDEGPTRVVYDRIPTLKPAFDKDGTITAANASTLNDGAAALVLTSAGTAAARGLRPLARIVAFGAHAQDPIWFTTSPIGASQDALQRADWEVGEVDIWEVNEAFAVVPMALARELGVPADKLNLRGGAISLGHPIGCSGARILVTLIASLRQRGAKRGLAAICIGGGEGMAAAIELISP